MIRKNTIKQFLKPNKEKLLIFLILFSILFLLTPFDVSCPGQSSRLNKGGGTCVFVNYFGWKFFEFQEYWYLNVFYYIQNFSLIFTLIISYFLSCLIIFCYNKLKAK